MPQIAAAPVILGRAHLAEMIDEHQAEPLAFAGEIFADAANARRHFRDGAARVAVEHDRELRAAAASLPKRLARFRQEFAAQGIGVGKAVAVLERRF